MGKSRNQAFLSIFAGYALCFIATCFFDFGKTFHMSTENLFRAPKREGVTLSRHELLCSSLTCFTNLDPKRLRLERKQAGISLPQSLRKLRTLLIYGWKTKSKALLSRL